MNFSNYEYQTNNSASASFIINFNSDTPILDFSFYLKVKNNFNSSKLRIPTSKKLIYDKASVVYFNDISSSMMEIPSQYNPFYSDTIETQTTGDDSTKPTIYTSYGSDNLNELQMSMWNGKFYSNKGWQTITGINSENKTQYNLINSLPVFDIGSNNYRWCIFKYSGYNNTSSNIELIKGVITFGTTGTNINYNDLNNNNAVFFVYTIIYNDGNQNSIGMDSNVSRDNGTRLVYYWLKCSSGRIGSDSNNYNTADATNRALFYKGDIADPNIFSSIQGADNFLNSSKTIENFTGISSFITANNITQHSLGFYFNKSLLKNNNTLVQTYISIGLKNDLDKYVKKPRLWLIGKNKEVININ